MELFENLEYWHWGILGAIFLILEMFVMGAFFLFTGLSAFVVLIVMLIVPITWPVQFIIWGILSVITMTMWKLWRAKNPPAPLESNINKRAHQYIDRTFTLIDPIENGFGKIKVDDSIWKVECSEDMPEGAKVKITDADGVVLKAEKAE